MVFSPFRKVEGEMPARRVSGKEHRIPVKPQFPGVVREVIKRRCAVPELRFHIDGLPVVKTVLHQHHIEALLEEGRGEGAVAASVSSHVEPSVDIDKDSIAADGRVGVVDINDLPAGVLRPVG